MLAIEVVNSRVSEKVTYPNDRECKRGLLSYPILTWPKGRGKFTNEGWRIIINLIL